MEIWHELIEVILFLVPLQVMKWSQGLTSLKIKSTALQLQTVLRTQHKE